MANNGEKAVSKKKARRSKVKELMLEGTHTQEEIAEIIGTSPRTIFRDIQAVKDSFVEEIKDTNKIVGDFLERHKHRYGVLNKLLQEAQEDETKGSRGYILAAIKQMKEEDSEKFKILQSLGAIEQAPEKLEQKIIVKWKE